MITILVENPQASTVLTFVQYFLDDIVLTAKTTLLRNIVSTYSGRMAAVSFSSKVKVGYFSTISTIHCLKSCDIAGCAGIDL